VFDMPIHTWPKRDLIQFNSIQCYTIALCTLYITRKQLQRTLTCSLGVLSGKGDSGKDVYVDEDEALRGAKHANMHKMWFE